MSNPISIDELKEEFELLGDPESQMDYLIDLGFELPKLDPSFKTEANRVHGCQSNVWMVTNYNAEKNQLIIEAESDAMIVNGLVCVLLAAYEGASPREILDFEIAETFKQLGLDRQLSPQRKNGLNGMVQRIRNEAAAMIAKTEAE